MEIEIEKHIGTLMAFFSLLIGNAIAYGKLIQRFLQSEKELENLKTELNNLRMVEEKTGIKLHDRVCEIEKSYVSEDHFERVLSKKHDELKIDLKNSFANLEKRIDKNEDRFFSSMAKINDKMNEICKMIMEMKGG